MGMKNLSGDSKYEMLARDYERALWGFTSSVHPSNELLPGLHAAKNLFKYYKIEHDLE